jgi:serine protease AprX
MNIRVMNLSFGTDSQQPYTIDPLAYAAEQAWKHGIVVVTSAGNAGDAGGLSDPADDPFVLAVGASDPVTNVVAPFSSTGGGSRNPDLVAPGVHVQSLRAPGSYIDGRIGSNGAINSRYYRGSGTSQAAAFVSGAVALMLQVWPSLTPDLVKYLIKGAARRISDVGSTAQGSGQLSLRVPPMSAWGPFAPQNFPPSTGTGSLDASRGSAHVTITDPTSGASVDVTGERDIFGNDVDTAALAGLERSGSAWDGGSFNGAAWSGDGWTSSSWASSSWASSSWASSSWASSSWASSSWASSSWASSSWASSSWASSSWAAGCWC